MPDHGSKMDPERMMMAVQNILAELDQSVVKFKDDIEELDQSVVKFKDDIKELEDSVVEPEDDIKELEDSVEYSYLEDDIKELEDDIKELEDSVEYLEDDIKELEDSVGELENSVKELQNNIKGLRSHEGIHQSMREQFAGVQARHVAKALGQWTWYDILVYDNLPQFGTGKCIGSVQTPNTNE